MTPRHATQASRMIPLWIGIFALTFGFPGISLATGYGGHGDSHHGSGMTSPHHGKSHHGSGTKGHGSSPHASGKYKGYGKGKGMMGGHGPHQSASRFIDHIIKFKDGMAITDDQVAKLRTIKTDFEKAKIRMKADIQLTSIDLHELLRDDKGSLNDVGAKLKILYDKKAEMYLASVKASRDAKAVLTTEQRSRMKAVHDRIKNYGGGMGKSGHPGGYKHHGKEKKS